MTRANLTSTSRLRKPDKSKTQSRAALSKEPERENGPVQDMFGTDRLREGRVEARGLLDNTSSQESVYSEAVRLLELVRITLEQDDVNRRLNEKDKTRRTWLFFLGIACLMWPSLLLFDVALSMTPVNYVEALEYSSQEASFLGSISRACLKIVNLAEGARISNKENRGILSFLCFVFLLYLLGLVRQISKDRSVMSETKRVEVNLLQKELTETVEHRRRNLYGSLQPRKRGRRHPNLQ